MHTPKGPKYTFFLVPTWIEVPEKFSNIEPCQYWMDDNCSGNIHILAEMGHPLVGHIVVRHLLMGLLLVGCLLVGCLLVRHLLVGCLLVGHQPVGWDNCR